MGVLAISAGLFVLSFVIIRVGRWVSARRLNRYWNVPVADRVMWSQIELAARPKSEGRFELAKPRKNKVTSADFAHHVWCKKNCKMLQEELTKHGYVVHRKMPIGDGEETGGFMTVVIKRKQLFNVKYPEGLTSETRSYILQFGPEAVLNIEEAVKKEFRRWGIKTIPTHQTQTEGN